MSFYRILISTATAMSLATVVFANEPSTNQIQSVTETTVVESSTTESIKVNEKVDINKASLEDLKKIKGLTTSKAKAIIHYRTKHESFKSLDELKNIKGFKKMKEKRLKEIQDQLTVG